MKALAEKPVDLVVSGINRGANVGINVIYSGTVSAATEGVILGVPSLAISLDSHREDADYSFAARFAGKMAAFILRHPLPHVAFNVNVPAVPEGEIRGVAIVKQGKARLLENFERRVDPRDHVYYWLAGETQLAEDEAEDSDAAALDRRWITITPLYCDLTRHAALDQLKVQLEKEPLL